MIGWRTAAIVVIASIMASGSGAEAEPASVGPVLHLSATGSVQASPDQLVADLVVQNTSASAAAAQRRVNSLMAESLKEAGSVTGVQARAIGYSVAPTDEKRTSWTAMQTLELRGSDGSALLDLTGKLQERGLMTASLDWQLSPAARRKAQDEATTAALNELQARAGSAAATLGLHIDHLQDVRLDGPAFGPRPQRPMMALARAGAPSPQATATPEDVEANVSADIVLRP